MLIYEYHEHMNETSRLRATLPVLAAIAAVSFWSFKPVFVTLIGGRLDSAEIFVLAALGAAAVAVPCVLGSRALRSAVVAAGAWSFIRPACASGAFLGLWYYGFYRALQETGKVEATIIAFTWPIIALIALPLLSGRKLALGHLRWALIVVGLIGAGIAAFSPSAGFTGGGGLVWAAAAAVGSGLYLPFAVRSVERMPSELGGVQRTFLSITVANLSALACVVAFRVLSGDPVMIDQAISRAGATGLVVCALIGVGTYVIAEVGWTWAMQTHLAPRLGGLPYLSPAVSTVLLAGLFAVPVTAYAVVGLVIVVGANLGLWLSGRSTPQVDDERPAPCRDEPLVEGR